MMVLMALATTVMTGPCCPPLGGARERTATVRSLWPKVLWCPLRELG